MFGFWFFEYNLNMWNVTARLLALVIAVLVFLPLHEIVHIKVAKAFMGLKCRIRDFAFFDFFDPIGAVFMLLFQYGWAKRWNLFFQAPLKSRHEIIITNLSGPLFNFFSAVAVAILSRVLTMISILSNFDLSWFIFVLYYLAGINVTLATINLLPVPPFDGFRTIEAFVPNKYLSKYYDNYFFISLILAILLLCGMFDTLISKLEGVMYASVYTLSSIPFMIFRGLGS